MDTARHGEPGRGHPGRHLIPARYDKIGMKRDWAGCARHSLEDAEPRFASSVRPGDMLVAGDNFGSGHAHYFGAVINACLTVEPGPSSPAALTACSSARPPIWV